MGYPTLPTAFDLKNRAKFQPPKGSEPIVEYINDRFMEVYRNSDLCRNSGLYLRLDIFDEFDCDHLSFIEYLKAFGYDVENIQYDYAIAIRW